MLAHAAKRARAGIGSWVTYRTTYANTDDATTYTFASSDLGLHTSSKFLAMAIVYQASVARTISSVTVAGSAATIDATTNASTTNGLAFAYIDGVTATSGNVVVTMSGASLRCSLSIWEIVGSASPTRRTSSTTTSGTLLISRALAANVGDVYLFAASCIGGSGTLSTIEAIGANVGSFSVNYIDISLETRRIGGYSALLTANGTANTLATYTGTPSTLRGSAIVFDL